MYSTMRNRQKKRQKMSASEAFFVRTRSSLDLFQTPDEFASWCCGCNGAEQFSSKLDTNGKNHPGAAFQYAYGTG
ncbi:hypothetical protein M419DRAFT_117215 [Trichoderma reesei RUT C-30]|uniref:Uncharacterized protein n=1 Tax=Hypocrea jecorina (strain ATCC 56765 / BCRC 32924 / NRRL 11460 / Rut C-30) TaxID=1344414 RepID=A0A024SL58_HYPJR|nr:hypothetical protein M419DRAFT_117215 [Trichoderma reesei RUT C-30]